MPDFLLLFLILVAVAVAIFAYRLVRAKTGAVQRHPATPAARKYVPDLPPGAAAFHWSDAGRHQCEVDNESVHQPAIRQLAGAHGDQNAATKHLATLVPDDLNPYQDKAVAVFIDGRLVGYLAHDDALRLRRKLGRQDIVGQVTSCDAVIRGGGLWNDKRLAYAVWLDLQPFD